MKKILLLSLCLSLHALGMSQKPDINNENSPDPIGNSDLHTAIFDNNLTLVKSLIEQRADSNALNNRLQSPLHIATIYYNNSPEIIETLINSGALINAKDKDRQTCLSWALLKNLGADFTRLDIDYFQKTIHLNYLQKNKNKPLIILLIKAGIHISPRDIDFAKEWSLTEIAALLQRTWNKRAASIALSSRATTNLQVTKQNITLPKEIVQKIIALLD
jgi:ankyrin repeat protein